MLYTIVLFIITDSTKSRGHWLKKKKKSINLKGLFEGLVGAY